MKSTEDGAPMEFVSTAMVAAALGVTRSGVNHVAGLPAPAVVVKGPRTVTAGFAREAVQEWADARGRDIKWPDRPEADD